MERTVCLGAAVMWILEQTPWVTCTVCPYRFPDVAVSIGFAVHREVCRGPAAASAFTPACLHQAP